MNGDSDIFNVQALQDDYPHLTSFTPWHFSIETLRWYLYKMSVMQSPNKKLLYRSESFTSCHTPTYMLGLKRSVTVEFGLFGLTSTGCNVNIDHDKKLASQAKSLHDIESFGANKQFNPQSAAHARAHKIFENTNVNNGLKNVMGMPGRQQQAPN